MFGGRPDSGNQRGKKRDQERMALSQSQTLIQQSLA
jgi:hypothetical protein